MFYSLWRWVSLNKQTVKLLVLPFEYERRFGLAQITFIQDIFWIKLQIANQICPELRKCTVQTTTHSYKITALLNSYFVLSNISLEDCTYWVRGCCWPRSPGMALLRCLAYWFHSHPAVGPTCVRRWITEHCTSFLPLLSYHSYSFPVNTGRNTVPRDMAEGAIVQCLFWTQLPSCILSFIYTAVTNVR